MKTLKELLQEKKEIEEQIRTLKKKEKVYTESGDAMLYRRKLYHGQSDEENTTAWSIGIMSIEISTGKLRQRRPIITGYDKKEVINTLPRIISDLQELYDKYKEAHNESD